MARKFYTYKRQVALKPGERVGFIRGKGYYAIPKALQPKPPGPPPPPAGGSVFAGKGLFTTSDEKAASGLDADWIAYQMDPEGTPNPTIDRASRVCYWMARPTQEVVDNAAQLHIPFVGQAENQPELERCLALDTRNLVAKALVGNAGSWTDQGFADAYAQGWDYISEWYWNAHPWETEPTGHNYPRFVNVCFGIYHEGEPGGVGYVPQSKSLADYRAVWKGSFSVWAAGFMTDADRAAFVIA